MPLGLMALVTVVMHMVSAQDRGSSILRQGGVQNIQSEIVTARTRAFLSCESGDMVVRVNFTQPFRGLMYAFRSRSSPCRIHGSGGLYYVLRIPLKGCGTWQESPRMFVNNITIRFHPALELEEDETKTLVCRYPPPLTPPPGNIHVVEPITLPPNDSTRVVRARLSEVEILIIICLLLFLSLLTLGIGIAYFCLKRRNIQLVRRKTLSSAPASQLTKLSSSTPPQPSLLSGAILGHTVRIPRAVPYSASLRTYTMSDQAYGIGTNSPNSPVISRDSLESSPTTSTTSGESAEGTQLLHYNMKELSSAVTIPKAVLRKDDTKRRTLPTVHNVQTASSALRRRSTELEDQTVTTVLDPEYSDYGNHYESRARDDDPTSSTVPVYAQVDKRKPRVRIVEDVQIMCSGRKTRDSKLKVKKQLNTRETPDTADDVDSAPQPSSVANFQESDKTSLYPIENTELRLQQKMRLSYDKSKNKVTTNQGGSEVITGNEEQLSDMDLQSISDVRNLRIQDISDVYVTTTVETESTEIRTTVSRDIIEEHVKDVKIAHPKNDTGKTTELKKDQTKLSIDLNLREQELAESQSPSILPEKQMIQKPSEEQIDMSPNNLTSPGLTKESDRTVLQEDTNSTANPTDKWNVIIRQLKPPPIETTESDSEDRVTAVPRFDVRIRTLPPETAADVDSVLDRRDSTELVDVPQLQMPHSIEKIRGIIAQLEPRRSLTIPKEDNSAVAGDAKASAETTTHHPKTVWWPENPDPIVAVYSPEPTDNISGSDSYRSESSLRERSSSEVLEKAPTLFTRCDSDNPGLERSTSEIVTDRGHYNKWTKDVPVFETYSPEFLANIPVVTQGGFFHGSFSPATKEKTESKASNI